MTTVAPKPPSVLPFVVMCVGMFMAILDIQVVASSLTAIADALAGHSRRARRRRNISGI